MRNEAPTELVRCMSFDPKAQPRLPCSGPPNTGKSSLHHALTGSHATVGPYPYTTHEPQPGMLAFEDVHFQLIDLPPVSPGHPLPWIGNALQPSDGGLVVVDLNEPDCLDQVNAVIDQLKGRRITLLEKWGSDNQDLDEDEIGDPFAIELPILLIAMKCDLVENIEEELVVFQELLGSGFPTLALSVSDPHRSSTSGALVVRCVGGSSGLHQGAGAAG